MIKKSTIPAVGYIRMSSDKQEASPAQQKREIKRLAKREGYVILRWYEDHGITGDSVNERPQFSKMLTDAGGGEFRVILCWDQDRFGRFDGMKAGTVVEPLRELGVQLVTVAQGAIDWGSFAGRLVYFVNQEAKNQFLHDLSRNIVRSYSRSVAEDKVQFRGSPPFDFDRIFYDASGQEMVRISSSTKFQSPRGWSSKLVAAEDKEQVQAIQKMFRDFANGDNLTMIATRAISDNVQTSRGGRWTSTTVRRMLENPVYVGDTSVGRFCRGKYYQLGVDGEVAASGTEPKRRTEAVKIIPNTHKGLVSRRLFDSVQEKLRSLDAGRTRPRRANAYLLSNKVVCGLCGAGYYGRVEPSCGIRYYAHDNKTDCSVRAVVRGEVLDAFVKNLVINCLAEHESELIERCKQQAKKSTHSPDVSKQIEKLDRQIERAAKNLLLADDGQFTLLAKQLDEIREKRAALADQQFACPAKVSVREVREAIAKLKDELINDETSRQAIAATIDRIDVWFEKPNQSFKRPNWRVSNGAVHFTVVGNERAVRRFTYNDLIPFVHSNQRAEDGVSHWLKVVRAIKEAGQPLLNVEIREAVDLSRTAVSSALQHAKTRGIVEPVADMEHPDVTTRTRWQLVERPWDN